MGKVYLAKDTKLNRNVALKFLPDFITWDPPARERFHNEARASAALNHPNITQIHALEHCEKGFFIVMEYVEGVELKKLIQTGNLSLKQKKKIALQVANALETAHQKGVIHRDVKSSNIMINKDGLVKVMDFGIAHISGETHSTNANKSLGTPNYMAPEQILGNEIDKRTDIWSYGVLLFELFSGELPFKGEYKPSLFYSILNKEPPPLEEVSVGVPSHFSKIISTCLRKDPRKRYSSFDVIIKLLKNTGAQASIWSKSRTKPLLITTVLISLLVISVVLYTFIGFSTGINSVAVLPFKNLSEDPKQDYFIEGMHGALISELSQYPHLKVINQASSMYFENSNKPLPQIGQELEVDALVIGSIYQAEDRIRFSAELVDLETEENIWTNTYEREHEDVFSLQGNVAKEIAREIGETLNTVDQSSELTVLQKNQPYRPSPEVYDIYLKGRYYSTRTGKDMDKAIQYFQEAIDRDPNFTKAYAAFAEVAQLIQDPVIINRGIEAAYKAVELNPNLSESQAALGIAKMIEWEWKSSEEAFQKAIELNPNNSMAYQWYAQLLRQTMRFEEAYDMARKAEELNPLSLMAKSMVGWVLFNMHRYEEAHNVWDEVLELDSEYGLAYYNKGLAYWMQGKGDKVLEMAKKAISVNTPVYDLHSKWLSAVGYCLNEQTKTCATISQEVEKEHGHKSPTFVAILYHVQGKNEEAIEWLEKAYEQRKPWLPNMLTEPLFDGLRDYPRFIDLFNRMDYPE
ncbi:protein kinase [Balneolaceae bacterium YR4-1]|uniref:non-specific serine/threonine protein kinase n=2 Tax=Halalkalibaculum roseum TaxID=2709311 RepID=A0A6M1SVV2_9BACT|nr:protein kinase [Halalkalibaculum roseum]